MAACKQGKDEKADFRWIRYCAEKYGTQSTLRPYPQKS